jgi:hypothetical protein
VPPRDPFESPWARYSPPIEVRFATAGAIVDVPHRLGATPTGYLVVLQTGAVYAAKVQGWDQTLASFTAPAANTVARIIFFVGREALVYA